MDTQAKERTTYSKLRDGSWGLRGVGLTAGETVTVTRRDGQTKTETVGRVLWTGPDGTTLATVASGRSPQRGGSGRGRRGTWTGCRCGSIEARPRDSDCAQCAFDAE